LLMSVGDVMNAAIRDNNGTGEEGWREGKTRSSGFRVVRLGAGALVKTQTRLQYRWWLRYRWAVRWDAVQDRGEWMGAVRTERNRRFMMRF